MPACRHQELISLQTPSSPRGCFPWPGERGAVTAAVTGAAPRGFQARPAGELLLLHFRGRASEAVS